MIPQLDLAGARRAQACLLADVATLNDGDIRRPSLLDGWTVGHVLTHLARNADAFAGLFDAADRGRVGSMYPGGKSQREHDINAGADRPAATVFYDVREACARLERAWDRARDETWAVGEGRIYADTMPLSDLVFRRWREVEVHHVDLGLGFGWADWPDDYVDLELEHSTRTLAARLPDNLAVRLEPTDAIGAWIVETVPRDRVLVRAPRHELLAWLLDRHERPDWPLLERW